jgi:hypothetical protein
VRRSPGSGIAIQGLAATLVGVFAIDNLLLWAFLGRLTPVLAVAASALLAGVVMQIVRAERHGEPPSVSFRTLFVCCAVAAALLILGGEGRFLYANFDWQVRDAVLADMGRNPWPYAYAIDGVPHILRAPVGMYLVPALIGGANQSARDLALLASNSVMFGLMLALATPLFEARPLRMALAVFILFSGLDVVGTAIIAATGEYASFEHLERWMHARQYSSTITQLFWVPQHAFAGWAATVLYLLWRRGLIGPAAFVAVIPLSALWSPLAVLGVVPFAFFAGVRLLVMRQVSIALLAIAAMSLALAMPGLVYLVTDTGKMAAGFQWDGVVRYAAFVILEVGLYLGLVWAKRGAIDLDKPTFLIVATVLLLVPLYGIGDGEDFMMRASIMPLAILSYFVAQTVTAKDADNRVRPVLLLILLIGAVTGMKEAVRVTGTLPSPPPLCTLIDVWTQQGERISPIGVYVARVASLPWWIRPDAPAIIARTPTGQHCWSRDWATPR